MSNYEEEERELTVPSIPEGINQKKSRMGDYGALILPVHSNMTEYGLGILTRKNDVSKFIRK